ncbi:MAG TPA: hypothetical protein VMV10_06235, partial [Pirellulales bacterium]|nr:hypothetical protein [Pirellulales bacterium]
MAAPAPSITHRGRGDLTANFAENLQGSSNIDVNVSVGTIFSIFRRDASNTANPASDVLQPGRRQVAAGYVLYGSSTMLVYSTGFGVHGFTLDLSIGAFVLSHPNLQMP